MRVHLIICVCVRIYSGGKIYIFKQTLKAFRSKQQPSQRNRSQKLLIQQWVIQLIKYPYISHVTRIFGEVKVIRTANQISGSICVTERANLKMLTSWHYYTSTGEKIKYNQPGWTMLIFFSGGCTKMAPLALYFSCCHWYTEQKYI